MNELAAADLVNALRSAGLSDVRADTLTRGMYSSDASLYRVVPRAVVMPRDAVEVAAVLGVCRELVVPLTARGGGTSIAGNAVGPGVVLDTSRYLNRVLEIDAGARTATVEPGCIHAALQSRAMEVGLRFGPDPSSYTRCAIGGMIGNNACGNRALGYGRTSDNVISMELLTGTGDPLQVVTKVAGGTPALHGAPGPLAALETLRRVVDAHVDLVRGEFGRFGRQVSGYALEHLLPENGFDVGRMIVGSEGTLAVVTQATVRLVTDPPHRLLVALGFDDIYTAGDVAPLIVGFGATAAEAIDARIVDVVRARRGPDAVPHLPNGRAWMFVELVADTHAEAEVAAQRLVEGVPSVDARIVRDEAQVAALWRIREDGAGLSGRTGRDRPGHSGWEDAAVPPEKLGAYLREFDALLEAHDVTGLPYGHFGDGCLHIRLDFDLDRPGGPDRFRAFLLQAADLVARYGGSISGEHGDGRARSELLGRMYSPRALELFREVKTAFDPENLLNPGILVDPDPVHLQLRVAAAAPVRDGLAFGYPADGGDFGRAVHRCTGVGKCRADNSGAGAVMCPSYLATREEKDSTRGRARILQEMVNGSAVTDFWRSAEVAEALDLCLACKGCASDCPTGVDMATYKYEVLYQRYKGRRRPMVHHLLGRLPEWARLGSKAPRIVNVAMRAKDVAPAAMRALGLDPRRTLPRFASTTFRSWWADSLVAAASHTAPPGTGPAVVVFVDTWTEHFAPEVGRDAVRVLRAAGYHPTVTTEEVCCGLTWISTGQLDGARRELGRTVAALAPYAAEGIPIVGLEPSCTAVLRHDAVELLGTDDARAVAGAVRTLAELLTATPDWTPPDLSGWEVVAQPHCHHHAIMTWAADEALLKNAGATVNRVGGCCGLAGDFGMTPEHYDVSVAIAEHRLLPAVRAARPHAVILADGFSCRTQLADLGARHGIHLAQLLANHLRAGAPHGAHGAQGQP